MVLLAPSLAHTLNQLRNDKRPVALGHLTYRPLRHLREERRGKCLGGKGRRTGDALCRVGKMAALEEGFVQAGCGDDRRVGRERREKRIDCLCFVYRPSF
jgi:hypothetical protein